MATACLEDTSVQIAKIASSKRLPTLPEVAIQLLEIAQQDEPDLAQAVRVIRSDPAISGRILKTVNSASFGFRRTIETIEQAVPLLGISMLRTLILGFHLASLQQKQSANEEQLQAIWRSCLTQAVLAELISEKTTVDPSLSFIAALLQDIGILAMITEHPSEYVENVLQLASLPNTAAAERAEFGFSHVEVTLEMVGNWNMGPEFAAAIRHHHDRFTTIDMESNCLLSAIMQAASMGATLLLADQAVLKGLGNALKDWVTFLETHLDFVADDADDLISGVNRRVGEYSSMFSCSIGDSLSAEAVVVEAKELLQEIAIDSQIKIAAAANADLSGRREDDELYRDYLSGLHNRRFMDECLNDTLRVWISEQKPIAMMFLDVDKFKLVNDEHGHKVGDEAIQHVAHWLSSSTRRDDIVIRLGGDEFLVMMQIKQHQYESVAQRITREIPTLPLEDGGVLSISLSVGTVFYQPHAGDSLDANWLIDKADQLMYEAKKSGGDSMSVLEV